jgi:hypothetical protein
VLERLSQHLPPIHGQQRQQVEHTPADRYPEEIGVSCSVRGLS